MWQQDQEGPGLSRYVILEILLINPSADGGSDLKIDLYKPCINLCKLVTMVTLMHVDMWAWGFSLIKLSKAVQNVVCCVHIHGVFGSSLFINVCDVAIPPCVSCNIAVQDASCFYLFFVNNTIWLIWSEIIWCDTDLDLWVLMMQDDKSQNCPVSDMWLHAYSSWFICKKSVTAPELNYMCETVSKTIGWIISKDEVWIVKTVVILWLFL